MKRIAPNAFMACAIAMVAVAVSVVSAEARVAMGAHCGGVVREVGGTFVEAVARGRRIEIRVRNVDDRPLSARGFVSTVVDGQAIRLTLSSTREGLLSANAPSDLPRGSSAIVYLTLPDGAKRVARFPLNQRASILPCQEG